MVQHNLAHAAPRGAVDQGEIEPVGLLGEALIPRPGGVVELGLSECDLSRRMHAAGQSKHLGVGEYRAHRLDVGGREGAAAPRGCQSRWACQRAGPSQVDNLTATGKGLASRIHPTKTRHPGNGQAITYQGGPTPGHCYPCGTCARGGRGTSSQLLSLISRSSPRPTVNSPNRGGVAELSPSCRLRSHR